LTTALRRGRASSPRTERFLFLLAVSKHLRTERFCCLWTCRQSPGPGNVDVVESCAQQAGHSVNVAGQDAVVKRPVEAAYMQPTMEVGLWERELLRAEAAAQAGRARGRAPCWFQVAALNFRSCCCTSCAGELIYIIDTAAFSFSNLSCSAYLFFLRCCLGKGTHEI
jgi:hypothetical protein